MDLKTHIGLKVRAARLDKRLTQEQLAEQLGKSVETVSNIERGESLTGLETLQKIAEVTGKTMASFFDDFEKEQNVSRKRFLVEEEVRTLISRFSDREVSLIIALIKTWNKEKGKI